MTANTRGFDITIAKYVAAKLGYANKQIVFKQVPPPETPRPMLTMDRSTWSSLLAYHR